MDFDVHEIERLSKEDRKKIVDYMEGMPPEIKHYIKINILNRTMDPTFFNSDIRELHEFSTLARYLGKNKVSIVKNPDTSCYQKEYCNIMSDIYYADMKGLPKYVKNHLEFILQMPCYDIDTLIRVEVEIGNFLSNLHAQKFQDIEPFIPHICKFISTEIMLYKFKVYDLYTFLLMNQDMRMRESDYRHMTNTHKMISRLIGSNVNVSHCHDIAILIYIYYKELGMESYIEKYNLLERFEGWMKQFRISEQQIMDMKDKLSECINSKLNSTVASSSIVNSEWLGVAPDSENRDIQFTNTTSNIDENNGFIFSFKNIKSFDPQEIDNISIMLRGISKDEIVQYCEIEKKNITFNLNENDIGHIKNSNKINIGTVYNSFSKKIRYIIETDGEFYLMFKDRMNSRVVYGISVNRYPTADKSNMSRKIITIRENPNHYYRYLSEI